MLLNAFADESGSRGQNEIAPHALPREMKFVLVEPHVGSRTVDGVLLILSVIGRGAGLIDLADVIVSFKDAEAFGLWES
jgi:hypothetical protein